MKPFALVTLLALAAAPATAGDLKIGIGYGDHGKGWHVRVGYRDHHRQRHHCHREWVPGHYDTVTRTVYVPGYTRKVYRPAEYGWSYDRCGNRVRVLIRPAGYDYVETPGHYETRCERVWVPGYWDTRCHCRHHRH